MSTELASVLEHLRKHSDPYTRKKAFCAAIRIVNRIDENDDLFFDAQFFKSAVAVIQDGIHNNGVLVAACQLLHAICIKNNKYCRKLQRFMKLTDNNLRSAPKLVDQFVMVHLLKLLRLISKGYDKLTDNILQEIVQHFHAVLYECVEVIMVIPKQDLIHKLAIGICGKFIYSKDNNLGYVALRILSTAAPTNYHSVQHHRYSAFKCLKESDLTSRKRALDLIYILTNKENTDQLRHICYNY
eukprot:464154_1